MPDFSEECREKMMEMQSRRVAEAEAAATASRLAAVEFNLKNKHATEVNELQSELDSQIAALKNAHAVSIVALKRQQINEGTALLADNEGGPIGLSSRPNALSHCDLGINVGELTTFTGWLA